MSGVLKASTGIGNMNMNMSEPRKFEAVFAMTPRWGNLQKVSVRYFPVYGTLQVKKEFDKDFRWADYYERDEVLNAPNFKKLYNEFTQKSN